jgi:glutamate-5-semialdehyde dehydrogenase
VAAAGLAPLARKDKDAALLAMADALVASTDRVLAANAEDVEAGRASARPRRCSTGCR